MCLAGCLLLPSPAAAQTPAEFYKGKQVSIYVGFTAGGTYDLYARVLARHIGRHIPGNPSVVPRNMEGAGIAAARELHLSGGAARRHRDRHHRPRDRRRPAVRPSRPRSSTRAASPGSAAPMTKSSICAAWHTSGHHALRRPQGQGICLRRHRPDRRGGADLQDDECAARHQDTHRVRLSRRQPDQPRDRARRDPRPLRAVVVEREGDACRTGSTRRNSCRCCRWRPPSTPICRTFRC